VCKLGKETVEAELDKWVNRFKKDFDILASEEVEINFKPIDITGFEGVKMTPAEMFSLDGFIKDTPPPEK